MELPYHRDNPFAGNKPPDDFLRPIPPVRALEIQTLVIATGAGLWLGWAQSFSHSTGQVYRYMRFFNEWTWASALLVAVVLALIGIAAGERMLRQLGLMVICLVWLCMTACFLAGNPYAFSTWTYAVLMGSAGYASLRL